MKNMNKSLKKSYGFECYVSLLKDSSFLKAIFLNTLYLIFESSLFIWMINGIGSKKIKVPNLLNIFSLNLNNLIVFTILLIIIKIIVTFLTGKYANKISVNISSKSFQNYTDLSYDEKLKLNTGKIVTIWGQDSSQLVLAVVTPNILLISYVLYLTSLLILSFIYIDLRINLLILILFIFTIFFYSKLIKFSNKVSTNRANNFVSMSKLLIDIHNFQRNSIIENNQPQNLVQFNELNKKLKFYDNQIYILGSIPRVILEIFLSISIIVFTYFSATGLNLNVETLLFSGSIILFFGQKILIAFQQAISQASLLSSTFIFLKRVSYPFGKKFSKEENFYNRNYQIKNELNLVLKDIFFTYENSKKSKIIGPINIQLPNKYILNITGSSGSGKSTTIDILLGLLKPYKGKIYQKYSNSRNPNSLVKLSNKNLQIHWGKISYAGQKNFFPSISIYEYLYFDKGTKYNKDFFFEVLKILDLENWFNSLNDGIHTQLLNGASNLSGGQKQRLALLKALINKPNTLIIDEATTGIPYDLEIKILEYIFKNKFIQKIIFITHSDKLRLETKNFSNLPFFEFNLDTNKFYLLDKF